MVGGGGLLQLPALFAALPGSAPAVLLGTSKCAGIVGTASAAARYAREVRLPWRRLLPCIAAALLGGAGGAMLASHVSPAVFRPLVPVMLVVVLLYTLTQRGFGLEHAPDTSVKALRATALPVGAIGVYDGFFGPGTGSFLMVLMVRMLRFDFLHAAAAARMLNVATNAAALAWFVSRGEYLAPVALAMAAANVAGAHVGTRLALTHGAVFVRRLFLAVVTVLIAKTAWDALAPLVSCTSFGRAIFSTCVSSSSPGG